MNFGHGPTVKKLGAVTNANYLSKMATGDMEITDEMSRSIETTLKLPSGWMDRDNLVLLKMEPTDFELYRRISLLNEQAKKGLLAFLSAGV
jgi:hypothetical protein